MFRIPRSQPRHPAIDLATVRETLLYMHDDMKRTPALEGVAAAISEALTEIKKVECETPPVPDSLVSARFLPSWTRG